MIVDRTMANEAAGRIAERYRIPAPMSADIMDESEQGSSS